MPCLVLATRWQVAQPNRMERLICGGAGLSDHGMARRVGGLERVELAGGDRASLWFAAAAHGRIMRWRPHRALWQAADCVGTGLDLDPTEDRVGIGAAEDTESV